MKNEEGILLKDINDQISEEIHGKFHTKVQISTILFGVI